MPRRTPSNPKLAIAYLRVSTDKQELGPDAQRAAIATWAAREGVHVAAEFVDVDVCGEADLAARPGLAGALAALRVHGAGVVLAAKLDRVARDVAVFATVDRTVQKLGARIVSAAGEGNGQTAADSFMRHVLAAAAEYELALIRGRTKAALAVKRSRGERTGEVAYGFRLAADGVHVEPNAAEQTVLAAARELRGQGMTLRAVSAKLAERGMLSRVGRPFDAKCIARMTTEVAA